MACLCVRRRQGATSVQKPVVLEGTLQSPKLLAAMHGDSAPETAAAVSALGGAIKQLQQQLSSVYDSRCMILPAPPPLARLSTGDGPHQKHFLKTPTHRNLWVLWLL